MKIEVSKDAMKQRIERSAKEAIEEIKTNASMGIDKTELFIDKDISSDVKKILLQEVDGIIFTIVRKAPNPTTGRIDCFSGETVGNKMRYVVKI